MKNDAFRWAIIRRWKSQTRFSTAIGLGENQVSQLVQGHRRPSPTERERLLKVFSPRQLRRFFLKPVEKIQVTGSEAVNAEQ